MCCLSTLSRWLLSLPTQPAAAILSLVGLYLGHGAGCANLVQPVPHSAVTWPHPSPHPVDDRRDDRRRSPTPPKRPCPISLSMSVRDPLSPEEHPQGSCFLHPTALEPSTTTSEAVFLSTHIRSDPTRIQLSAEPKGKGRSWLPRIFIDLSPCHTHYTKWYGAFQPANNHHHQLIRCVF